MEGLLKCIGDIPEGQKSEHIVVTGDIVWFGKRDEYDEAKTWFLRLLEVTGLKGKDLTFCVGNHDVNWSYGQIIDGLSQWHTRRFDLSSLLYSHFILGHTNFMVGSLLFKCDLLPSRFIGSEES